jgi:hypothetical protein
MWTSPHLSQVAAEAQRAADAATRAARTLDPGSTRSEQLGTQAAQASRTASASEAALAMLRELQAGEWVGQGGAHDAHVGQLHGYFILQTCATSL